MATFLQLAQAVARESGTGPANSAPASVVGQIGRQAKFVEWTKAAWLDIQNSRSAWFFLQGEMEVQTIPGAARYTRASFTLPRLMKWPRELTIYDTAAGPADEASLTPIPWSEFYRSKLRGVILQDVPNCFSVSNANELVLYPTPDRAFTLRGEYRKTPQTLEANDDIPDMPEEHHQAIVWRALVMLSEHDESAGQNPVWIAESRRSLNELERDQLPEITIGGGPLA